MVYMSTIEVYDVSENCEAGEEKEDDDCESE